MNTPPALNSTFYDLTQTLWGAIAQAIGLMRSLDPPVLPPSPVLQLRTGYAESPGWFLIQAAEFAPEPLTVQTLRVRDTYASEALVRALLEIMASEKWFDREGESYSLRPEGLAVLTTIRENRRRWLETIAIPDQPALRLHARLGQLIASSLQASDPPGTWCLAHSRNRAPAPANTLADIWQYTSDFNAIRDDSHMAAWRPLGVDGHTWESFTTIANETAATSTDLFDQLAYRGYSVVDNVLTLANLEERGWLHSSDGGYVITDLGRDIRGQVEQQTDDYFYAPWATLATAEQQELHSDINELIEQLSAVSVAK